MSRFTIVVAKHDTEPNTACYDDFVHALGDTLCALGHEVASLDQPGRLIMFNAVNMFDPAKILPKDAILFNTEQVAAAAEPSNAMLAHAEHKHRVVWDYSEANAEVLRNALGMERVVLCPLGYFPSMTRITPVVEEDIDVLFYGALSARRKWILKNLINAGLKVKYLYGSYGAERDQWIARSKIVLNLHYGFEYGAAVFEIFRCSHLFANKKCVVTEDGGIDPVLEDLAKRAAVYRNRDRIVDTCCYLAHETDVRRIAAEQGFNEFSKIKFIDSVRQAVEAS